MNRPEDFVRAIQESALRRQGYRCGSCGTKITALGRSGQQAHKFGESAQAHHVKHVKLGGKGDLANCVILCSSCHYSVHEGGNFRHGKVSGLPTDYPYYRWPR
jgi:5-methylcytosine-specific restriction endonuclease McrA